MKGSLTTILLMLSLSTYSQTQKYSAIAKQLSKQYDIPASIILASYQRIGHQ